jgi:aspartokinase
MLCFVKGGRQRTPQQFKPHGNWKRRGSLTMRSRVNAKVTDELTRLARQVSPRPPRHEMDMLLSAGERISCAFVTMAVERLGRPAVSFTGSQAGILEVRAHRVQEALERGQIALVAGFQGLSTENQATTLGRGDSDTSAQRRTRARAGRQDLRGCDSTQIHESSLNPGRFTPHPNPGLDRSQGPL